MKWSYEDENMIRELVGLDGFYYEVEYLKELDQDKVYDEVINFIGCVVKDVGETIKDLSSEGKDCSIYLEALPHVTNLENLLYDELSD